MKSTKMLMILAGMAFFVSNASLRACDKNKPCAGKKSVTTVASTNNNDGRSDAKDPTSPPCALSKSATKPCGGGCKGCQHAKSAHAVADQSETKNTPCGSHGAHAVSAHASSDDRVTAVLASMPAIRYQVGDATTSCPKHAKALAGTGGSIQYLVGDDAFSTEDDAVSKLAELTEAEVNKMMAVHFVVADESFECPMSAKKAAAAKETKIVYRVAGFDFNEREAADKVAELAKAAVSNVQMRYKVGGDSFCCDRMAGVKAKETGKAMEYEVAGNSTPCAVTAKRLMAEAKLRAAVETAAQQVGS